jgi:hypothetical protein
VKTLFRILLLTAFTLGFAVLGSAANLNAPSPFGYWLRPLVLGAFGFFIGWAVVTIR